MLKIDSEIINAISNNRQIKKSFIKVETTEDFRHRVLYLNRPIYIEFEKATSFILQGCQKSLARVNALLEYMNISGKVKSIYRVYRMGERFFLTKDFDIIKEVFPEQGFAIKHEI